MKRLDEALEIGPKYTQELKQVHVRTLRDLANVDDLQKLGEDTHIPIELIQNWHEQAKRKVKASRYRRRVAAALAIVALATFGWLFRRTYKARDAASQAEVQGEKFYDDGNYGAALTKFDRAIQLNPKNKFAHANRGGALLMVGRAQDAIPSLDKALELDPSDVWSWDERGKAYADLGQFERALKDFEKAMQFNPKYASAYADKAYALRNLGRTQEALDSISKALELDPEAAWAYSERANIYHDDVNQYEAAYQDAKKAVELAPGDLDFQSNLAEAALTSGRLLEAHDLASKILADNEKRDIKEFGACDRLSMRFIAISALLLQNQIRQAKAELEEFVAYYRSVGPDFKRDWDFSGTEKFVQGRKIDSASKNMILELINLLEEKPKSTIDRTVKLMAGLKVNGGTD